MGRTSFALFMSVFSPMYACMGSRIINRAPFCVIAFSMRSSERVSSRLASSITSTRSRSASASIKRGLDGIAQPVLGGLVNHLEWRQGLHSRQRSPVVQAAARRRAKWSCPRRGCLCTMVTFPKGYTAPHSHSTVCVSTSLMRDNLDGFFLRRFFQSVNRFPDILPVCDFCPVLQYLVPVLVKRHKAVDGQALRHKLRKGGCKRRFRRLVAVKAEVNGLDVRAVRGNATGLFSHAAQ